MKTLEPGFDVARFFEQLTTTARCALLLDYDGTLAPFRVNPRDALPYPGVREVLDAIAHHGRTRLVVISGRWTRDLEPLLGLRHTPEIWGSHGRERLMPDGSYELARPDESALRALAEADTWVEEIRALGGRSEQKPASLAIHWRGLPAADVGAIRARILENWALLARESSLSLHEFDGGIELRVPGRDKGDAVNTVFSEMGAGGVAAYLGDDLTDEDGFRAIKGKGLGALVRSELRPTAADIWLRPPAELLDFLWKWHESRGGSR